MYNWFVYQNTIFIQYIDTFVVVRSSVGWYPEQTNTCILIIKGMYKKETPLVPYDIFHVWSLFLSVYKNIYVEGGINCNEMSILQFITHYFKEKNKKPNLLLIILQIFFWYFMNEYYWEVIKYLIMQCSRIRLHVHV